MPKREMINMKEEGDTFWSLMYADEVELSEGDEQSDMPQVTLERLSDFCDQDAESVNSHDYVGTHRILAALLYKELGREKATHIMREIAEYGGLHGMSGCQGAQDAFADFGIEDCWEEWELPK